MNSPNLQEDSKTAATDIFQLNPLNKLPTLATLCAKVVAANPKTFTRWNNGKRELKCALPHDASEQIIEAMRNLSYLKATPLDNNFFSLFVDGNRSRLRRLDLRNCEIDDSMLNKLLVVHGRNLASLNLSQGRSLTGAAIPVSIDLRNLHTLDLGDQLSLFTDWRPGDDPSRLITAACPKLCSLKIDMAKWSEIFHGNETTKYQSRRFLRDLLARNKPVHVEVSNWNHGNTADIFRDRVADNPQSLVLPSINDPVVRSTLSTISWFWNLRSLDISRTKYAVQEYRRPATILFNVLNSLPLLEALDISNTNLTNHAMDDDNFPPGPYKVRSTISGLLGLHKPLKFLSIFGCGVDDDVAVIPADVVASDRNLRETLIALRHYEKRVRVLIYALGRFHDLFAEEDNLTMNSQLQAVSPMQLREFLDIVGNRATFSALAQFAVDFDDFVAASLIGSILNQWCIFYLTAPAEDRLDNKRKRALFCEIQRTVLQLTEVLLNSHQSIQWTSAASFLCLTCEVLQVRPNDQCNDVYIDQLLRIVGQILASKISEELRLAADEHLDRVFSTVADVFSLAERLVQSGNEAFIERFPAMRVQEEMVELLKFAPIFFPHSHPMVSAFVRLFEALWSADDSFWSAFVNVSGLEVLARATSMMATSTHFTSEAGHAGIIEKFLQVLSDSSQPPIRRYAASAIVVHSLCYPMLRKEIHLQQNEMRSAVQDSLADGFPGLQPRDVVEVTVLFAPMPDRVAMLEAPTVQCWAVWSMLKAAESEPLLPYSDVQRLRQPVRTLIDFGGNGFAVPDELLKMARKLLDKLPGGIDNPEHGEDDLMV